MPYVHGFAIPGERLREQAQHLDHLEARLQQAMLKKLHSSQERLARCNSELQRVHPERTIAQLGERNRNLSQRLHTAINNLLQRQQQRLASAGKLLNTVSPLETLGRGYAIATDSNQNVVRSVSDVDIGQSITARLSDGELQCRVESIDPAPESTS